MKASLWKLMFAIVVLLAAPTVLAAEGGQASNAEGMATAAPTSDKALAFGDHGRTDMIICQAAGDCDGGPGGPGGGGGGGGTCTPSWSIISSQASGGFAVQSVSPSGCDYYGVTKYTWHDSNQCGDPDYQSCSISFHTFRSDFACCSYYWCGGDTCGYN